MRRLQVALPGSLGILGLGQSGLHVARAMRSQGWEVRVLSRDYSTEVDGFPVVRVEQPRIVDIAATSPLHHSESAMLNLRYGAFDRGATPLLGSSDALYCYPQASLHLARRAGELGVMSVLYSANTFLPAARRRVSAEYRRLRVPFPTFDRWSERRVLAEYAAVDYIRAESSLTRDSLVEGGVPADKVWLVTPSVDLEHFKPSAAVPDVFTVAFVGAFSVRKGFHHLLAAWDRLRPGSGRLLLHGGHGNRWARVLAERAGARADTEVIVGGDPAPTYRRASVCVVPSIEDGFCYVVLEAMASGIPVIVSDQAGARDVVEEGVSGFVVRSGDVDAITAHLETLRDDPSRTRAMGLAARRAAERFTADREGTELGARLDSALAARPASARGARQLPARST